MHWELFKARGVYYKMCEAQSLDPRYGSNESGMGQCFKKKKKNSRNSEDGATNFKRCSTRKERNSRVEDRGMVWGWGR